jgi:WD40 repeat protein
MHMQQPKVIFVQGDDPSDDAEDSQEIEEMDGEQDFEPMPTMKRRKVEEEVSDTKVTRYFTKKSEMGPVYSGGTFHVMRENHHRVLCLNDGKISLIDITTSKQLGSYEQENEEIVNFAVSPNERLLVASHKSNVIRVFSFTIGQASDLSVETEFSLECIQTFKTPGQLCLELCFDPSSRYVAVGSTDGQVKVFDSVKGFQTHNFLGHRGVITQLAFYPKPDALKLISSSEDFTVRVWDLVLNSETACLRDVTGRVAVFLFSPDLKTLMVGAKDARITFYNIIENFK